MIFDTHAHYDDRAFDPDRDRLLANLTSYGIGRVVNVTSDHPSLDRSLALSETYDYIYTSVGLHPTEVYEFEDTSVLEDIAGLALRPKVVAIGEIGLDYHYDDTDKPKQLEFFEAQLQLASRLGLPVIIHSRDAAAETLDMMRRYADRLPGGVIHCFSYSYEMAAEYVRLGFHIGIGGVVTFKNSRKLKECAAGLPLESIVLETDCPYLAPVPHRGERNSSLYLNLVAREIAGLRGISEEDVISATWDNGLRLYGM